ncbi:MAG: cytochrome b/b6 domain-containing protein [Deltaproteobacteria bacterium]|nr:cytochrome b/b6 domain-containing protein [Deltaproteobacteria bacterium]
MNECKMERIYLYTRFERFWHWVQAGIVVLLGITGFEIHGTYELLGFQRAVEWHNTLGITWLVLYAFIIFWHLTTGQWKHYVPTTRMLFHVALYYMIGIFRGEPHPVPKSERFKHNPLQRLTYLGISVLLIPFQMATGLLYYTYNSWPGMGLEDLELGLLAGLHMAGAFALLVFLVVHIYMTTTGHSVTAHIRAMCTGWEEVPAGEGAGE